MAFSRYPFLRRLCKLMFRNLRFLKLLIFRSLYTFGDDVLTSKLRLKLSEAEVLSCSVLVLLYLVEWESASGIVCLSMSYQHQLWKSSSSLSVQVSEDWL